MIYFGALWILYRFYPPKLSDLELGVTGLFYPTAIRQFMTGVYFMELCLSGLFLTAMPHALHNYDCYYGLHCTASFFVRS